MANGNFGGGSGSSSDPYLVEDSQDLSAVSNRRSAHYQQVADIDFGSPVGGTFSGVYDGHDFIVANLSSPLFGSVSGTVKNLGIVDSNVSGSTVGILAGSVSSGGVIHRCHTKGSVTGGSNVGGLVGEASGATITQSYSEATVEATGHAGGLVGSASSLTCRNCYATGDVGTDEDYAGGFIGNSINDVNVENSYASGSVSGLYIAGGFSCGQWNATTRFISCFAMGATVTGWGPEKDSSEEVYAIADFYAPVYPPPPDNFGLDHQDTNTIIDCFRHGDMEVNNTYGWETFYTADRASLYAPRALEQETYEDVSWDFSIWSIDEDVSFPYLGGLVILDHQMRAIIFPPPGGWMTEY